jgi:hypothetical protein
MSEKDQNEAPPTQGYTAVKSPQEGTPPIVLGEGILSWPGSERRSDRYGLCGLLDSGEFIIPLPDCTCGKAMLVAEVVERIQSEHIGDLFHGFRPPNVAAGEGPAVGDLVILSEFGEVRFVGEGSNAWVGVKPDSDREVFLMNPHALYAVNQWRVKLLLFPEPPQEWLSLERWTE